MNVKNANVNLLLGKVKVYLDTQPEEKKKGKRFVEAEKAVARMRKLFAGTDGVAGLKACGKGEKAVPGIRLLACGKGEKAVPGIRLLACGKGEKAVPGIK